MLPPAHYSAGLASGLATYLATGNRWLGLAAAFLSHLPLDWLVDEYWDWREGERVSMVKLASPLIITGGLLTAWLWTGLPWWPLVWGLAGVGMDLTDTPLRWLTAKMGWWRQDRSEAGIELFPCHYYSPWYWGQAWPRMLSFYGTLVSEYAVCVPVFLYIWLTMK